MRKIMKKIFSPKVMCVLALLVQVAIVVAVWVFLEYGLDGIISGTDSRGRQLSDVIGFNILIGLRIVLYAISLIVFFRIVNREENPEYKIPWIAFMFLVPLVTLTFYLLFVRVRLRRKDANIVLPTVGYLSKRKDDYEEEHQKLIEGVDPQYRGVFNYLRYATNLNLTKGNRLTYYKTGEVFFPALVETLKEAEKFIFIEFFIIGEGVWWTKVLDVLKEKAAQGVEVRVIYDDIGSAGVIAEDLPKQLAGFGIKCQKFHPFVPILSSVINNRDHRKIVVVDHKAAFTGGMNLADEYANEIVRFGYWKDTMVKIEGKGVAELIATFLQNYDLTTFAISDYDEFLKGDDYREFEDQGYAFSFGDAPGPYNNFEQIGEQNYINLLNVATKKVYISTPYLITSYPLIRAVLGAAKRGVEVNLIVPGIPDKAIVYWMAKCQFKTYLAAGVNIYIYTPGFNHEKQMLVDDRLCFVGTINFDFRSLTHHFESGMTFVDAPCLPEIKADFEEMMSVSEKVHPHYRVGVFQTLVSAVLKLFRVLF